MTSSPIQSHRTGAATTTGWGRYEYTGWIDESSSWKDSCYLGDWSFLDELVVSGPDALKLFSDFAVNSFAKFELGQAKHIICCSKAGKVIGEGILMRLAQNKFEFQALGPVTPWLEFNLQKGGYRATAAASISKFKFQVSGPKSVAVLEKLVGGDLRNLRFMYHNSFVIAGVPVTFIRQGMAGEIGFEVQGPAESAKTVTKAILAAGEEFGIRRLGSRTAMINHLEACFPTVTHDYIPAICEEPERDFYDYLRAQEKMRLARRWSLEGSLKVKGSFDAPSISAWYRSPVELGWIKNIKFDHEFYGRGALESEVAHPKRTIMTLVWDAADCIDVHASLFRGGEEPYEFMDMPRDPTFAMNTHIVSIDGRPIGAATSRSFSYTFRKMLSHCVIDMEFAQVGRIVEVVWGSPGSRQKKIKATVAGSPFKKDNRRADISASIEQ